MADSGIVGELKSRGEVDDPEALAAWLGHQHVKSNKSGAVRSWREKGGVRAFNKAVKTGLKQKEYARNKRSAVAKRAWARKAREG
jgi:hypothetical protein